MTSKKISHLTSKERLIKLNYDEIYNNFGDLKNRNYSTEMFGNTFYIHYNRKGMFGRKKQKPVVVLCCACGVCIQTFLDILESYYLLDDSFVIDFRGLENE